MGAKASGRGPPGGQTLPRQADEFGMSWQVVPTRLPDLLSDPDPDRANRAMQAMLGMKKLVIADLEGAADG